MDRTEPGSSEKQKMLAGDLYNALDPELVADRTRCETALVNYNIAIPEARDTILRDLLATCGTGVIVRPSFSCDYGYNIHLADSVFLNFNCVLLDVTEIHIGARTQIGPAVQIYTADHPRDPSARHQGLESGKPIRIGADVWIGGGAILLPGITVGDNAVIGAGSVVTHDVPPGITVAGNPARPLSHR
ncbi:sugar O-acetyltransferase [Terriglobus sp.]|uniref:sugar O-acetyltransferase n=1 Tax=Terriglobus sp. TaxID=1889013 RepID=UPI003AFFDD8C